MRGKIIIGVLVTAFLWYVLVTQIDIKSSVALFKDLNPLILITCVLIFISIQTLKALRFQVLLNDGALSFRYMFSVVAVYSFLGQIMPAKTGEGSFPLLLKKSAGVDYSRSIAGLIVARSYDLISVLFIYSFFLIPVSSPHIALWLLWIGLICVQAAVSLLFLKYLERVLTLVLNFFTKIVRVAMLKPVWAEKFGMSLSRLISDLSEINMGMNRLKSILCSFGMWFLSFSIFYLMVNHFDKGVDFKRAVLGSGGVVIANMLPLNVLGNFGIIEAGWTVGYVTAGMNKEAAFASGLLLHSLMFCLGFMLFLAGMVLLKRYSRD